MKNSFLKITFHIVQFMLIDSDKVITCFFPHMKYKSEYRYVKRK